MLPFEFYAVELLLSLLLYLSVKALAKFHSNQERKFLMAGLATLYVFFNLWIWNYSSILGKFLSTFTFVANTLPIVAIGVLYYVDSQRRNTLSYFSKYVDKKVVEQILARKVPLKGQRKHATVVFTDVRGFTSMSEKLPPEEVVEILNGHFDIITDVAHHHGGTVLKFIGDAAMIAFNVPLPTEAQELKAVEMSKDIISRIREYSKRVKEEKGVDFSIGIGISSGEVVVGNIGSERQYDYTLIGDAVNTASRLNGVAGPWEIVVEEKTARKAGIQKKAEKQKVKGKKNEVSFVRLIA